MIVEALAAADTVCFKLDYRGRHAQPIAGAFFCCCHNQRQRINLVNSVSLVEALAQADDHEAQLRVYMVESEVPIDTKHLERALRVIPMGHKNQMDAKAHNNTYLDTLIYSTGNTNRSRSEPCRLS
jgi:hypothetical protein